MKINKLYVYGCSISSPYWMRENDAYPYLVSKESNCPYVRRSESEEDEDVIEEDENGNLVRSEENINFWPMDGKCKCELVEGSAVHITKHFY